LRIGALQGRIHRAAGSAPALTGRREFRNDDVTDPERKIRPLAALARLDSHHRFFIALCAGAAVLAFTGRMGGIAGDLVLAWTVFAAVLLLLAWAVIVTGDPATVRRSAVLQDASRTLLLTVVVLASCGSLWGVWALLGAAKALSGGAYLFAMVLAPVSVAVSWCLVHTVFTLRYAHVYYGAGQIHGTHHGGLEFPGDHPPDYVDFAYYAFVVGMTAQVSDVQVTSRRLRKLTLIRGVISFAFNTVILALTINVFATATLS